MTRPLTRTTASGLALLTLLAALGLPGCGKYGPPQRSGSPPAQAQPDDDEESG
jgi:hypothetical protein